MANRRGGALRTLLLGVVAITIIVGCSGRSPSTGDVEQTGGRPGSSSSPASGVEPGSMSLAEFREWLAFVYTGADRQYQSELEQCMEAKGFEYVSVESVSGGEEFDNPLIDTSTSHLLREGAQEAREDPTGVPATLESLPAGYDEALGGIDGTSGCTAEVRYPDLSKVDDLTAEVATAFRDGEMPDAEGAWLRCLEEQGFAPVPSAWGLTYETAQQEGRRLFAARGYQIEPDAMLLGSSPALDAIPYETKIEIADELREFEIELGEVNTDCQASSGLAVELQERLGVVLASVDPSVFDLTFDDDQ